MAQRVEHDASSSGSRCAVIDARYAVRFAVIVTVTWLFVNLVNAAMARFADALKAFGFDATAVGHLPRFFERHRLAEDIALDLADAEFADQVKIVMRLDALGRRIHSKALRQRDDGADDCAVALRG